MSEINKRISHTDILEQKTDGKKTWNVQALRSKIRELTKEANLVLLQNEDRADYKQLAARIQEATDSKAKRGDAFVGNLNFKNVQELEMQLQGLQQFLEYDTLSDQAKKKQNARFEKAFSTYEQSHKGTTRAEFEKIVQMYSAIGDLSKGYGSDNIKEIAEAAREQGIKINLTTAFQRAENYAKEHGVIATPENIMDIVYSQNGIERI